MRVLQHFKRENQQLGSDDNIQQVQLFLSTCKECQEGSWGSKGDTLSEYTARQYSSAKQLAAASKTYSDSVNAVST